MFIFSGSKDHIEQRKVELQQIKRDKIRRMPIEDFKKMLITKLKRKYRGN